MARRAKDPKAAELAATRTLNRHPEAVTDQGFAASEFFDPRDLVQVKYEMVRKAEAGGAGVSAAAAAFGFSRQSCYTAAAALAAGGLAALVPARPGPKGGHKLTAEVLTWAEEQLAADPGLRAKDLASPLEAEFGVRVHPRSIEKALARYREGSKRPRSPG
jgi:transposase